MTADDRFAELWTDYLEGDLGEPGVAKLQALLEAHPHLRGRAADLFQAHRLLGFALQDDPAVGEAFVRGTVGRLPQADEAFVETVLGNLPAPVPSPRRRGFGRTFAGTAAGLLLGVVATSAAWAYSVPRAPEPVVLLADGFEAGPPPRAAGVPTEPGVWGGDFAAVTGSKLGVSPAGGAAMLRVLRADYDGKPQPDGSYCGDLFRLIDLRPYRGGPDGPGVVRAAAGFNALAFPADEGYTCSVAVHALAADAVPGLTVGTLIPNSLAMARQSRRRLDRDPATWERVDCELRPPPDADFLVVHLVVCHVPKLQKRATFDGHFVDDVRVTLTPDRP